MEFNNQNGSPVQDTTAKDITIKAAQNGEAKKGNASPKVESEKTKTEPIKNGKAETPKPEPPKVEEAKPEVPQAVEEAKPAKPALNLEGTLKVVEDLHRRSIQRVNLITRIKQLEAFEVLLTQEHDELEDNPYHGCKLIIEDDKQRRFITTTPGLIRLVSQFIFNACHEKLRDIETSIVFPKA
ncbi:MAG: hypothetical protein JWR09_410 [Mucilaginibacter sp.]|nr:hypothetical protein [Mucilaginibacter sp.]